MELKDIYEMIEVRDEQVKAYDFRLQKNEGCGQNFIKIIQNLTDGYAQTLAESFMVKNKRFFMDEENKRAVKRFLSQRGADKPHSGLRFLKDFTNR